MPTIPPERAASSASHEQRDMAESFGTDAERYDRTRPSYPDDVIQRILAASPGRDVLDVGCGTGIVARQFRAAGCRVLGIEPDPRMAEFARRGGIEVEVATFEDWDRADRRYAAVVAGQTWHWVDPVAGAAKAARALRPGGRLALFWHVFEPPEAVADAQVAAFRRAVPDAPLGPNTGSVLDVYHPLFTKAEDGIRAAESFGEPEQWWFDWERTYTRDEWLDQMPTHGILTRVPAPQRDEVLDAVGAAIDDIGGGFTMSYRTVVVSAERVHADS